MSVGEARSLAGELRLRGARMMDLDRILKLEQELFPMDAWSRDLLAEELGGSHREYFVCVDAKDTVWGYGGVLVVGDGGDIQTIAVHEDFRGRGMGRRLLHCLVERAVSRGAREVFLEVRADNVAARNLYTSFGFEDIAVRSGYYQPGSIDAIVMRYRVREQ